MKKLSIFMAGIICFNLVMAIANFSHRGGDMIGHTYFSQPYGWLEFWLDTLFLSFIPSLVFSTIVSVTIFSKIPITYKVCWMLIVLVVCSGISHYFYLGEILPLCCGATW